MKFKDDMMTDKKKLIMSEKIQCSLFLILFISPRSALINQDSKDLSIDKILHFLKNFEKLTNLRNEQNY